MHVEVAYALRAHQELRVVHLDPGATVRDAVRASGLAEAFPHADLEAGPFGIFGRPCSPDTVLGAGDRVEIYRPLRVDPKEARRRRARR